MLRPKDEAAMDAVRQASDTLNKAIRQARNAGLLVAAELNGESCYRDGIEGFQPCCAISVAVGQGTAINAH